MPKVCFYFLLHQPYRLRDYRVFDLGKHSDYYENKKEQQNKEVFLKVCRTSYEPMLTLLLELLEKQPQFKFSLSMTGTFLEQAEAWQPEIIEILKKITAHQDQVEVLVETYYHSMAALYSPEEFRKQVKKHLQKIWKLFKVKPTALRNTELIYSNEIGRLAAGLGYELVLTEAVPRYLGDRKREQLFRSYAKEEDQVYLLLKNAEMSDDIAFRFSQKSWVSWPLTADKYIKWLDKYGDGDFVNLFMDFETFGEHQWAETGIFDFFRDFVNKFIEGDGREKSGGKRHHQFVTPTEAKEIALQGLVEMELNTDVIPVYDVPVPISWADQERDISAWVDNALQKDALKQVFDLEKAVWQSQDLALIDDWQKLTTSDHYYYMCTKYFSDGDVHAYFNAYNSPLEAYRRFCIVLSDLKSRVLSKTKKTD